MSDYRKYPKVDQERLVELFDRQGAAWSQLCDLGKRRRDVERRYAQHLWQTCVVDVHVHAAQGLNDTDLVDYPMLDWLEWRRDVAHGRFLRLLDDDDDDGDDDGVRSAAGRWITDSLKSMRRRHLESEVLLEDCRELLELVTEQKDTEMCSQNSVNSEGLERSDGSYDLDVELLVDAVYGLQKVVDLLETHRDNCKSRFDSVERERLKVQLRDSNNNSTDNSTDTATAAGNSGNSGGGGNSGNSGGGGGNSGGSSSSST